MDYYLAAPHSYLVARIYVVSYLNFDGILKDFLTVSEGPKTFHHSIYHNCCDFVFSATPFETNLIFVSPIEHSGTFGVGFS